MAMKPTAPKVSMVKRSAIKQSGATIKGANQAAALDFQFVDNEDSTCTVMGIDAGGNTVDISTIATLEPPPTSSNPGVVSVDPPNGMLFAMHAVGPLGTANIEVTAKWNDGSKGPFAFTLPVNVIAGQVSGIVVVPGTPTTH